MINTYCVKSCADLNKIAHVIENESIKYLKSSDYNYAFNKKTGIFIRYGKTVDDDPDWSEFGPEIADIEISTICHQGCEFCYKSNTPFGENMDLETFKKVLNKFVDKI